MAPVSNIKGIYRCHRTVFTAWYFASVSFPSEIGFSPALTQTHEGRPWEAENTTPQEFLHSLT